ncbi:Bromodomain-containing protein, partial [Nadsonia fulvescens var. elongata DSM 6958]
KHQLKFALAAIRSLKRLKDAGPFLHPVDAVKLNIPTYYDVIQNPMDISTMEKKLNAGEYETVMEFGIDMEYIVANCVAFNGPDSFISNMVKSIKASFDKHMQNMPLYELVTAASRKKKASTPVVANGNTSGAQKSVPVAENSGLEIKSETGRPRREIHPPKPKDMPYSDMRPRNKRYAAELRFCSQVLKELYSKKHKSISFAFLQPVDPVALDCPTYFDIVKKPMDLGTVTQKLNNNQYENGDEFRDDIKQIFENCYAFNPKGSPVNIMGHQLESVFDKKWEEKPIYQPTPPPASSHDSEEDESDDEETVAATTNPAIAFLEQQLERMKQDLLKMKKEAAKEARKAAKALAKKRKSKKSSEKRKTTKRRRRSSATKNEPMTISYEMQQELARKIYTLDEQKTAHVINIIHQSMPELSNNGQGEIELDMDLLDRNTLEKLYKFVVLEGKKLSINSSSFNMNGSKPSSKAKTTKKRSKSLTEAEQAKQIEDIQKKIKQFDHNGNENIAESSNEESSDDDSDESSSEE